MNLLHRLVSVIHVIHVLTGRSSCVAKFTVTQTLQVALLSLQTVLHLFKGPQVRKHTVQMSILTTGGVKGKLLW